MSGVTHVKRSPLSRLSWWISVKDKLPESGQTVLVAPGRGIAYHLEIAGVGKWISQTGSASGREIHWEVTHWMPMIDPPEAQ
jgi:hypothetical protein